MRIEVERDASRVRVQAQRIGVLLTAVLLLLGVLLVSGCGGQTGAAQSTVSSTLPPAASSATTESAPAAPTPSIESGSTSPTAAPTATGSTVSSAPTPAGTLQVHYIDVGQGDSELIISPEGKIMLIDGGEPDSGALAYLQAKHITHIDLMVATHPHEDHIGGLVDVLDALPVKEVVTNGVPTTTATYEHFLDAIKKDKSVYKEAKKWDTLTLGSLKFSVLSADKSLASQDMNQTSLVLRLVFGKVSFLFMGDAGKPIEEQLLAAHTNVSATILKVGHHGSSTASSPEFLAAVHPQLAVYSCGLHNTYGHPAAVTISDLAAAGATVYGTDQNGTVVVTSDGSTYKVECEKGSPRGPPAAGGSQTTTESTDETETTAAPAASGPLTLKVTDLTSPAPRGSVASLSISTSPGASCTITVHYKSGPSKAKGLDPTTADDSGTVEWDWKVSSNTTPGTWKITVTAKLGGVTKTITTSFVVS